MKTARIDHHRGFGLGPVGRFASRCAVAGLAVLALFVFTGCNKPAQLIVPLDDRPTDHLNMTILAGQLPTDPNFKIAVVVTDSRTDKNNIGQNVEDSARPIPVQTGTSDPGTFLQSAVAKNLADAGLSVVGQPSSATRVLTLDLQRFWVEESSTYRTEIRANAKLTGATGVALWQGMIGGNNRRFGRSLSVENYQEALSDAALQLTQNLLGNPGFQQALK